MDKNIDKHVPPAIIHFPELDKIKENLEKLRTELSMLVLERDELIYVICKNLEMTYMLTFGGLEYKIYEMECALLRLKRKAELIQAKISRQEKVIETLIDELLEREFAEYLRKLKEQMDKMNAALERSKKTFLSDEETRELKNLYRRIVKVLHPDLYPNLDETISRLFQNAVIAYENGDLEGLRVISAMVNQSIVTEGEASGLSQMNREQERLTKMLQTIKEQIDEVKSEFPYSMKSLIQDPEKKRTKISEMKKYTEGLGLSIETYKEKIGELLR